MDLLCSLRTTSRPRVVCVCSLCASERDCVRRSVTAPGFGCSSSWVRAISSSTSFPMTSVRCEESKQRSEIRDQRPRGQSSSDDG